MKRFLLTALCTPIALFSSAQIFSGTYTTEWHWDMQKKTNWVNQLRLNLNIPLCDHKASIEASTLHMAKTNATITGDWQTFSNIEVDNCVAAIAVLGYHQTWRQANLFAGVRNVNEDFFTSPLTSIFLNSSCGLFPTIAASYPIANYPVSGLTLYFDVSKRGFTFRNSLYNGVGYMGWNRHDNPFLVRPKRDGVFNISQLEYTCSTGQYYVGAAIHSRHFANPIEAETLPENAQPTRHTSCAWWGYAEQKLWGAGGKDVWGMLQYSENTSRKNACHRYAELGATYADSLNTCGVSAQFAQFSQGKEYSLELTYKRQLNASIALQPSFQYIKNKNGNYTVVCARLYYDF